MQNTMNSAVYDECSPNLIASFMNRLGSKVRSFEGVERRAHDRFVVAIPSIVQPLDDRHIPLGKAFAAVTRDISIGGIGLLHSQPVVASFLGVRIADPEGKQFRFLVKMLRCQPLGEYFDIGGEFVTSSIPRDGHSDADSQQPIHPVTW